MMLNRMFLLSAMVPCAMARRAGEDWYVSVLNCDEQESTCQIDPSFLSEGEYQAVLYYDGQDQLSAARIETGSTLNARQRLSVRMRPDGGFVARLARAPKYSE